MNQNNSIKQFIPIDKIWIQKFRSKCAFDSLSKILSESNSLNYESIIEDFLDNNYISFNSIKCIPKIKKVPIYKNFYYYDEYELITLKSYQLFEKIFRAEENYKQFGVYKLYNDYIFIEYKNNIMGELYNYKNNERYFINSDNNCLNILINKYLREKKYICGYFAKLKLKLNQGEKIRLFDKKIKIANIITLNKRDIINNKSPPQNLKKSPEKNDVIEYKPEPKILKKNNITKDSKIVHNIKSPKNTSFSKNIITANVDTPKCIINDKKSLSPKESTIINDNYLDYNKLKNNQVNKNQVIKRDEEIKRNQIQKIRPNNNINIIKHQNISNIKPTPQYEFKIKTKGLVGLTNIGATCYMNATLQCFSNIPRLREHLLHKNIYNNLYLNKSNKILSYSLAEVLYNLWLNPNIKEYAPNNFKTIISKMNPLFQGIAANDAKDLILFILETIHQELNQKVPQIFSKKVDGKNFQLVLNEFYNFYTSTNLSIISDEFYGYYNAMLKCCSCNVVIHNVQIMNILFFPLENVRRYIGSQQNLVTLQNCFEYYRTPEILEGDNQIFCNNCLRFSKGYSQNYFIYTPKTLIINFNRGKGLQFKINIKFDEYINIKNYIYLNNSPYYYELVGVISHLGSNDMGGHFIAFCKNSYDCLWYKYNDSFVTKSSFQELTTIGLPYVLFYSYVNV